MKTKLILLVLILLLSASCLCVSAPLPPEEMLDKYTSVELVLGFLAVATMMALPLIAPVLMFPKIF